MGLSGTELILKQMCNVLGLKPDDITNSIEAFKTTIGTVKETQANVDKSLTGMDKSLTSILTAIGTIQDRQADIMANQQFILNMLRLQQEGVAPGHVDLMEEKLLTDSINKNDGAEGVTRLES